MAPFRLTHFMNPDFSKNYFELFDLPIAYRIETDHLDTAYRKLQSQVHPDRFARASDAERRLSMQWATYANEAYQALKKPLSRARYLIKLQGIDTGEETNTAMPSDFLMKQMEWRETVIQAKNESDSHALDVLEDDLAAERRTLLNLLEKKLDVESDYSGAAVAVRKLRFLEKLQEEIEDAMESVTGSKDEKHV